MSDPRAWLEERQALADAATDGPREAEPPEGNLASPTQGTFVEVFSWTDADAEFIADARQSVPAMAAALTAVLDLHHKDDAGPGRDTCESCSDIEEVTIFWPCDTVRAIQAALGGEE